MKIPGRRAIERANAERAAGIPDREPLHDDRDAIPFDLRKHGGKNWQIEPRPGYASCRLRDVDTEQVVYAGTLKQCLREVSRLLPHRLGNRNLLY